MRLRWGADVIATIEAVAARWLLDGSGAAPHV